MRLPAITAQQHDREAARELHERLWAAYEEMGRTKGATGRVTILASPGSIARVAQQVQWRVHKFWLQRGYRLRSKIALDHRSISVWLEAKAAPADRVA